MSDSLHPLSAKRLEKHPLIAKALAAVAAEDCRYTIRASAQVAGRIHCPMIMSPIAEEEFFHASPEEQERAQEKAIKSLERILEELA